jgi:nucleotide-binding universal stress UspA family protein
MFKLILVPLDGSRFSSRALTYGIDIAQRFGAKLILMQAIPAATLAMPAAEAVGPSPAATEILVEEARKQDKRNIASAKRYLTRKLKEVDSHGVSNSYRIVIGDPAYTIMSLCKKEHIDLVVMTTHGKSGFKRAILGSVADEVIRGSKIPVLVIRPPARKRK